MKTTLTFVLGLFFCFQLSAQKPLYLFPGWKIKHIGASVGEDKDMIHRLDHHYLLQTTNSEVKSVNPNNFDHTSMTSMICENPHYRLDVAVLPPGMRNTEMRLALVGIFNRIDEVTYLNGSYNGGDYESLQVSSTASELGVEMSMLKHTRLWNSLGLYGGVGTNIGYVFDGYVSVSSSQYTAPRDESGNPLPADDPNYWNSFNYSYDYSSYQQRDGISQRLFAHAGAGLRFFKRVEMGFEYRYGIGYRAIASAPVVMTNLHSGALTLRWLMK